MPTSAVALALCQPPLHHLSASRGSRTPDRVQMPLMCLSCPDPWGSTSSSLKNAKDCGRCQAVDVSQRCVPPPAPSRRTLCWGFGGNPLVGQFRANSTGNDRLERQAGTAIRPFSRRSQLCLRLTSQQHHVFLDSFFRQHLLTLAVVELKFYR